MFKTKSEVDKHAGRIFMRTKTDSERNKECLKIARLYFDLKEFQESSHYLANYLSECTLDPYGWKLQAEICEMHQKNYAKAIEYYSKSFELGDCTDKRLLLKICQCYLSMSEGFDEKKATHWLKKAEQSFQFDKVVLDLKEKLLNLNNNGVKMESSDLETFLIDQLNENLLNDDLHLKLINIYMKNSNYSKAIRHIIKIEYGQYFSSQNWYKSTIESIETHLIQHNLTNKPEMTSSYCHLLNLILSVLLNHRLKLTLQSTKPDYNLIIETFLKLDKCLKRSQSDFASKSPNKSKREHQIIEQIIAEQLSQFYFVVGLLLTTFSNTTTETTTEPKLMPALTCFLKSSLISKPNSHQLEHHKKPTSNDDTSSLLLLEEFLKLTHRDSAFRYSIVGNWLNFVVNKSFGGDQIEMAEKVKAYGLNQNIKSLLMNSLKLDGKILAHESFLLSSDVDDVFFKLEADKLFVFDYLTLDLADKMTLENQSSNLSFLIWHCLMNTKFGNSSTSYFPLGEEITEMPPHNFFFRFFKSTTLPFGVTNLNICNLESLCLIDLNCITDQKISLKLKLFFYSTYYQSLSYLKNNTNTSSTTTELTLQSLLSSPFHHPHITSHLCTDKQAEWWSNVILTSTTRTHHHQHHHKSSWLNAPIDEPLVVNNKLVDTRRKNELAKVLELIRLKSSSIKLTPDTTTTTNKYKQNLKICVCIAKYLQQLYSNDGVKDYFGSVKETTPKEKQAALKLYLTRYWNFVCRQVIKLKQIENLDGGSNFADLSSILDLSENHSSLNDSIMTTTTSSSFGSPSFTHNHNNNNDFKVFKDYFVYYESSVDSTTFNRSSSRVSQQFRLADLLGSSGASLENKENRSGNLPPVLVNAAKLSGSGGEASLRRSTLAPSSGGGGHVTVSGVDAVYWEALTQTGLLNLIYLNLLNVVEDDGSSISDMEVEGESTRKMKVLDEAISLFNLMDSSVSEKAKNGLNKNQLELCKKIAECLIEQRDELEVAKNDPRLVDRSSLLSKKMEKTNLLIELIKKTLNSQFVVTEPTETTSPKRYSEIILNTTEKTIDEHENENESDLTHVATIETKNGSLLLVEKEAKREEEEEATTRALKQREKELDEERQRLESLRLQNEEKLRLEKEKLEREKLKMKSEMDKIRLESVELEKRKSMEKSEKKVAEKVAEGIKANESSNHENRKVLGLIDIMNEQKLRHFEMDVDTLKEQFGLIKSQYKMINNEIKLINKCTTQRMSSLAEFESLMKNLNRAIDMEIYSAQFFELYYLFERNPSMVQAFIMNPSNTPPQYTHQIGHNYQQQPMHNYNTQNYQSLKKEETPVIHSTSTSTTTTTTVFTSSNSNPNQSVLEKPIGDLNFPTNFDIYNQMKTSVDKFNSERSMNNLNNETEYYDQEEEEEEEEEEDDEGNEDEDYDEDDEEYEEEEDGDGEEDVEEIDYEDEVDYEDENGEENDEEEGDGEGFCNDQDDRQPEKDCQANYSNNFSQSRQDTFLSCNDTYTNDNNEANDE